MATYYLRTKVRSRGKSPISGLWHAAYLTRQAQANGHPRNVEYGQEHTKYITEAGRQRDDYVYHAHGNLPSWAKNDGLRFWASADKHERANGLIYREYEMMIPKELSRESWIPLAKEFTRQTLGERFPYTLAVHCPLDRQTKEPQPHIHLQFSQKRHDEIERNEEHYWKRANSLEPDQGGAPKERYFNTKQHLYEIRREWAVLANSYLEREGHVVRIDHRSLKEQTRDIELARTRQRIEDLSREISQVKQEVAVEQSRDMHALVRTHVKDPVPPQRHVATHTRAVTPAVPEVVRRPSRKLAPKLEPTRDRGDEWQDF